MEFSSNGATEALKGAANHLLLVGAVAILASEITLQEKPKDPEPPESNGQASEKGGPQGDTRKPYEPKPDSSKN